MTESKSGSMKGWNILRFLAGRKKLLITLVGAIAGYVATQNPALSLLAGASSELIIAVLEYFLKSYK